MRYIFFLLLWCLALITKAQSESVMPTYGVTIEREAAFAIIEKKEFNNVIVEIKAASIDDLFVEGVRIFVKDADSNKTIFKKRFSKSFLYGFSDGTIQVGKGNVLTQLYLFKKETLGGNPKWLLQIKEKGIY